MRKTLCLVFSLIVIFCLSSCGFSSENDQNNNKTADIVYITPTEAVKIDLNKEDPSSDTMKFVYDENGRVVQCLYNLNNHEIYINYTYDESTVQIYAFSDDVVAAQEKFVLPGLYDSSVGFVIYRGYYFKGYDFSESN